MEGRITDWSLQWNVMFGKEKGRPLSRSEPIEGKAEEEEKEEEM
jgi:hypothetical protein